MNDFVGIAKDVATILGVIIGALSLAYTAYQTRVNAKTNKARFWLELRRMFAEHNEVHGKLLWGVGEWHDSDISPSKEEIPKVIDYMGLFEHCKLMLDDHQIDWHTFETMYAYRIDNLLSNKWITQVQLKPDMREGWKHFVPLVKKLEKRRMLRHHLPD